MKINVTWGINQIEHICMIFKRIGNGGPAQLPFPLESLPHVAQAAVRSEDVDVIGLGRMKTLAELKRSVRAGSTAG